MSRTEALVDGWLTAQVDGTEGGCRQPALAGNLPAAVDASTGAKSLIRKEVDGIDGTSPAREARGGRADAGAGAARVTRVTRDPSFPSTEEKFNGDSDLESHQPVNHCRQPAGHSVNQGAATMSSQHAAQAPMKKAVRTVINQRANDLGNLFANEQAKPWLQRVLIQAGVNPLDAGAIDAAISIVTPLCFDDWARAYTAPMAQRALRAEIECKRLQDDLDDRDDQINRLRNALLAAGITLPETP